MANNIRPDRITPSGLIIDVINADAANRRAPFQVAFLKIIINAKNQVMQPNRAKKGVPK